jgi:hypothetical protein
MSYVNAVKTVGVRTENRTVTFVSYEEVMQIYNNHANPSIRRKTTLPKGHEAYLDVNFEGLFKLYRSTQDYYKDKGFLNIDDFSGFLQVTLKNMKTVERDPHSDDDTYMDDDCA